MRLTDRQAALYRELVEENPTKQDALDEMRWFLEDWRHRDPARQPEFDPVVSTLTLLIQGLTILNLAKHPEVISRLSADMRDAVEMVTSG